MLEEAFGVMQREVGSSIRELNEKGTILLGLFQTQLKESRQIRLRVEQLETKVDANTALLNEHTRMLGVHTKILDEHTTRFDRLESMLTEVLARLPEKP